MILTSPNSPIVIQIQRQGLDLGLLHQDTQDTDVVTLGVGGIRTEVLLTGGVQSMALLKKPMGKN